ncbi:MAG: phosphoglycolate phosphatase [Pseudomonadota bacterium]
MTQRFSVAAITFDLDGTLLDTVPDLAAAAQDMAAELGIPPRREDEVRVFVGRGIPNLVERCLGERAQDAALLARAIEVFKRCYRVRNGERAVPYDGAHDTLVALQKAGFRLACVTNKAVDFTLPLLEQMDMRQYFGSVVGGDTLPQKKPDPAPLLHAVRELGVAPSAALHVGDSYNDIDCARNAGISVLGVPWGYSEGRVLDAKDCDGLLSSLPDLLSRVALPTEH